VARARTYDFRSPFTAAWIIQNPEDSQGTRFPLWVEGVDPSRRSALVPKTALGGEDYADELGSLAWCTEVTVELQLSYVPRITATLTPPVREGMAFLNSPLIEWGNSLLEVQFGYTGGAPDDVVLSPVFSGVLLKPEVTIGADISVTLNAQGIGSFTAVRQDWVQPFQNKTRRKIISALAQLVGLDANFDDVDAPLDKELAAAAQQVFETVRVGVLDVDVVTQRALEDLRRDLYKNSPMEQVVTVAPGGATVWQLLYQVVREAQCWMYVQGPERPGDPEQLRVVPRNSVMTGEPQCTLVLFDHPDGETGPARNTFPVVSVSSPTSAVYLPAATRGYLVFGYDSKERTAAAQVIDPNARDVQRTGNAQTQANATPRNPAADPKKAQGMAVASSDSLNPEYDEQIRAEAEAAATNMGVKLEVETLGVPDILPAHVVAVRGVGSRFDGNYAVFKVSHSMGNGGTSTKLELVSNVGQLARTFEKETLPKTKTNDQKPPVADAPSAGQHVKKAKRAR
jgi:hypothetical protein